MNCVSSVFTAQALLSWLLKRTECNFGSFEISAARPPHDRPGTPRAAPAAGGRSDRSSRGSDRGRPAAPAAGGQRALVALRLPVRFGCAATAFGYRSTIGCPARGSVLDHRARARAATANNRVRAATGDRQRD